MLQGSGDRSVSDSSKKVPDLGMAIKPSPVYTDYHPQVRSQEHMLMCRSYVGMLI